MKRGGFFRGMLDNWRYSSLGSQSGSTHHSSRDDSKSTSKSDSPLADYLRITYALLPYSSKWLYVDTERGNVHIVNIDSFQLSGYVINWNKAIELSRKTHPGSVIHLSDCPIDPSKLLIGYESGTIVLQDLRSKSADSRVNYTEPLRSISWHYEGRQYLCSHTDGSITTWNVRAPRPVSVTLPHAKQVTKELKPEPCRPIYMVEWKTVRDADSFIIFSAGLPSSSLADVKSSTNVPTASASTPPVTTTSSTANSRENILISASSGSTSSDSGSDSQI